MTTQALTKFIEDVNPQTLDSANALARQFNVPVTTVTRLLRRKGYVLSTVDNRWHLNPDVPDDVHRKPTVIDTYDLFILGIPPTALKPYDTVPVDKQLIDPSSSDSVVARTLLQALQILNDRRLLPVRGKISLDKKGFVPLNE